MNAINRREFFLGTAGLSSLPLWTAIEAQAGAGRSFRLVLPSETTFAVNETIPLRILTKSQYPRLQVNFKINGQSIGTATAFPYQINWTPTATGDYALTVEITERNGNFTIYTGIKVLNLLYDGIGRRGNRFFNVESWVDSYEYYFPIPENPQIAFGYPMNYTGTQNSSRTVRQIDLVFASVELLTQPINVPVPLFNQVMARWWNDGNLSFQSSPKLGNLSNTNVGTMNFDANDPLAVNSQGIRYFLGNWTNLSMPLPAGVKAALSLQFWVSNSWSRRIRIAQSTIPASDLLFATAMLFNAPTFSPINATAVRIWTD